MAPRAITTFAYTGQGSGQQQEMLGKPYTVTDPLGRVTTHVWGSPGWQSSTDPLGNNVSGQFNHYRQLTHLFLPLKQFDVAYGDGSAKGPTSRQFSNPQNQQYQGIDQVSHDGEYGVTQQYGGTILGTTGLSLDNQYALHLLTDGNNQAMHSFTPDPFHSTGQYQIGSGSNAALWTQIFNTNGNPRTVTGPISTGTISRNSAEMPTEIDYAGNQSYNSSAYDDYSYRYDAFGRVTGTTMTPSSYPWVTHSYTYDDEDHVLTDNVAILNGTSSQVSYTYAPCGARTSMNVAVGPGSLACNYVYDKCGNLTTITANGVSVSYTYDANDRVVAVRTPQATTLYTYDNLGQATAISNLTADNVIDDAATKVQDPINQSWHSVFSTFSNVQYDLLGDRTHMEFFVRGLLGNTPNNPDQAGFNYSNGYVNWSDAPFLTGESWVLSSASPSGSSNVQLDHYLDNGGNLTTIRDHSLPVDSSVDQIVSRLGIWSTYSDIKYDASGGMSTFRGLNATYNLVGELRILQSGFSSTPSGARPPTLGNTINTVQLYDADGRRVERDGLISETFVYDGDALVARFVPTGPGSLSSFYVWGPTGPIMEVGTDGNSTYMFDPSGNTVARLDTHYGLDAPHIYDGYGQPVWPQVGDPPGYNAPGYLRLMFRYKGQAGYYTDTDSDLIYCHHRYYDPMSARWITRDPAGLEGGINPYGYCDGSPLTGNDPSWLDQDEPSWGDPARYGTAHYPRCFGGAGDPLRENISEAQMWRNVQLYNDYKSGKISGFTGIITSYLTCWELLGQGMQYGLAVAACGGMGEPLAGAFLEEPVRTNFEQYSVIVCAPVKGLGRTAHRTNANKWLNSQMASDSEFAKMIDSVLPHGRTGLDQFLNPPGTEWHHPTEAPTLLQLMTVNEHRNPLLRNVLHPNRKGGYARHYH